jgi:hypothetical protein
MNERIKALAVEADFMLCEDGYFYSEEQSQKITDGLQKFAELIVRECMNTIKQNENASLNISNFTDEKKQGIQLGLEFAITDIAEHFGVEE